MDKLLNLTRKRLFIQLAALSIFSLMACSYLVLWLIDLRLKLIGLSTVATTLYFFTTLIFILSWLFLANLVFNIANIRLFSFLDKYIFYFINALFPLIVLWGKILGVTKRRVERSFIMLNNHILLHHNIRVKPAELLVISPHCLQLASCPYKITHNIMNCKRCNQCTVGPLVTMSERLGFNFRVVTGGTLARKLARELRPKMVLAIACERDLASGIKDVYPLPAAGVLNIRPNGPCYNTTVDLAEVETMIKQFIT